MSCYVKRLLFHNPITSKKIDLFWERALAPTWLSYGRLALMMEAARRSLSCTFYKMSTKNKKGWHLDNKKKTFSLQHIHHVMFKRSHCAASNLMALLMLWASAYVGVVVVVSAQFKMQPMPLPDKQCTFGNKGQISSQKECNHGKDCIIYSNAIYNSLFPNSRLIS